MSRLGRRAFLSTLGAASLLGLASGREGGARAAEGPSAPRFARNAKGASGKPLRFIGVYTPHGRAHELWAPRGDFDIGYDRAILGPLDDAASHGRSFKEHLLVLDGVDLAAGIAVGTTGHDGSRVILTGSGADGKNSSLDQFLAVDCGLGQETMFGSLVLGVGNEGTEIGQNISYAAGGTPIPKWIDPALTWYELFGRQLGASREELEARSRRGQSVLDLVRADLGRLQRRVPASEKTKLEQHAAALRDIEQRLSMVAPRCEAPAEPAPIARIHAYGGGERNFDAITDLQIDLLVRAMACDLTRFATLHLNDLSRTGLVTGYANDVHTDVAHRYDARTRDHEGTPSTWEALAVQNRYSMTKLARLLAGLAQAGVLDDTIVYVSSDMGDTARHSSKQVPTLLAGGAGGRFRMGRSLAFGKERGADDAQGLPNNRILVSICQAFGVETERFGHSSHAHIVQGGLSELWRS